MEAGSRNHLVFIVIIALVLVGVFSFFPDNEWLVFGSVIVFTLTIMAHVPGWTYHQLTKRQKTGLRQGERCREWTEKERIKAFMLGDELNKAFRDLLSGAIFLLGLTAAYYLTVTDFSQELAFGDFGFNVSSMIVSLSIMMATIFLCRAVPLFLVKVINNFGHQLRTLEVEEQLGKEADQQKSTELEEATKAEISGNGKKEKKEKAEEHEARDEKPEDAEETEDIPEKGEFECQEEQLLRPPEDVEKTLITFFRYIILFVGVAYALAVLGFNLDATLSYGGLEITVSNLVNAILTGVILAMFTVYFFPLFLNALLVATLGLYARRYKGKKEKLQLLETEVLKVRSGLERTLLYVILLAGLLVIVSLLGEGVLGSFMNPLETILSALLLMALAFFLVTLTPLVIYTISIPDKQEDIKESHLYQAGKYVNYVIILLAFFFVLGLVGMDMGSPISFGETSITIWGLVSALMVLMVTFMVSKMITALLQDTMLSPEQIDEHASVVLVKLAHYGIVTVGIMISVGILGINLMALVTGLGIIGFALAFGMQDTIANFVAGIMIAIEKPFRIGDRIRVGEESGDVIDIGIRSTQIRTTKNEVVIIPNNLMVTNEIWNLTKDTPVVANVVSLGIDYDADWHQAEQIAIEIANAHPEVVDREKTHVRMVEHGDSSINIDLWMWIENAKRRPVVKSDVLKQMKDKFDEAGISIPFPHRTLTFKYDSDKERYNRAAEDRESLNERAEET